MGLFLADERLTDRQIDIGSMLFDHLCHYNPQAVSVAQGNQVDQED